METADAIGFCQDRMELLRSDGAADEDILSETETDIYAESAVIQMFVVCLHSETRHSYGWLSDKEEPDIN